MDVRCEKCSTEYSLDETLVSPSGTSVRCTTCNHVFKAYPPRPSLGPPETWRLRQVGGATFPFDRLSVLQDWIATGKVTVDDAISKGSGEWKRLGDIAEMKPFFDAAHAARASRSSAVPVAAGFPQAPDVGEHLPTIRHKAVIGTPQQIKPNTASFAAPFQGAAAPMARPQAGPGIVAYAPSATPQAPLERTQVPAPRPSGAPQASARTYQTDLSTAETLLPGQVNAQGRTIPQAPAIAAAPVAAAPPMAQAQQAADDQLAWASTLVSGQPAQLPQAAQPPPRQSYDDKATQIYNPASREAPTPKAPVAPHREPDLSQVPAAADERWEGPRGARAVGPAWAERGGQVPGAIEQEFEDDRPRPRRRIGRWIVLALVILVVGGGVYLFAFERQLVGELLGKVVGEPDGERYRHFFLKGRESFLLDTEAAFTQADREYHQVLALREGDTDTLVALAEMYAVWAQHYRDMMIDARADAAGETAQGTTPGAREAKRLQEEFERKHSEARRWSGEAARVAGSSPALHLALADVARLGGDLAKAAEELGKAAPGTAETAYLQAMLAQDRGDGIDAALGALTKSGGQGEPLLRALYRQARLRASKGETDAARAALSKLFELNSDHDLGRALARRLDQGLLIAATMGDLEAAATASGQGTPAVEEADPAAPQQGADGAVAAASKDGAAVEPAHAGAAPIVGQSPEAMLMRAAKLQENGQTDEAMAIFESVLARSPGNIDALSGMGYCYLDKGNRGQAISFFRRILGVNPSYGPAIIGLAQAYKAQGQKDEALRWYRKYVELHPSSGQAQMARRNIEQLEGELGASGEEKDTAQEPPPGSPSPEGEGSTAPTPEPSDSTAAPSLAPTDTPAPAPAPAGDLEPAANP